VGYVTVTSMTFDKQSNVRRIEIESYVVTTALPVHINVSRLRFNICN